MNLPTLDEDTTSKQVPRVMKQALRRRMKDLARERIQAT